MKFQRFKRGNVVMVEFSPSIINDNLNMYINDHLRMYTSDYALI